MMNANPIGEFTSRTRVRARSIGHAINPFVWRQVLCSVKDDVGINGISMDLNLI